MQIHIYFQVENVCGKAVANYTKPLYNFTDGILLYENHGLKDNITFIDMDAFRSNQKNCAEPVNWALIISLMCGNIRQ